MQRKEDSKFRTTGNKFRTYGNDFRKRTANKADHLYDAIFPIVRTSVQSSEYVVTYISEPRVVQDFR
jgi:hypothetical protein